MKPSVLAFLLLSVACAEDRRPPITEQGPVCGNGRGEAGEQCDGNALGSGTCGVFGFGPGTLTCSPGCRFDPSGCGAPTSCGNGTLDAPERCDTARSSTVTCADLGFGAGTLSCAPNCAAFDTSGCGPITSCGDGRRQDPEVCDGVQFGGSLSCVPPARRVCSADCRAVTCVLPPSDAGASPMSDAGSVSGADASMPGADATVDPCANETCSGHGVCAVARGAALCVCDPMFEAHGLECTPVPTGAPTVMLTSEVASLDPQTQAVFDATVSDPDGLADVLGGELRAPSGESYGQFTRVSGGAFRIELSWNQIDNVLPINGAQGDALTFVGVFFDAAGNNGSGTVSVPLSCQFPPSNYLICNGLCLGDRDARSCGSCDLHCHDNFQDMCVAPGACEGIVIVSQDGPTCAAACTTHFGPSAHCVRAYGQGFNTHQQSPATCSSLPRDPAPGDDTFDYIGCTCAHPAA